MAAKCRGNHRYAHLAYRSVALVVPGFSELDDLHCGERIRLARARRTRDGRSVLLKIARASDSVELAALEKEFSHFATPPWDLSARELELVRGVDSMALVLEDRGGVPLRAWRASSSGVRAFIDVALKLTSAVGELHRLDFLCEQLTAHSFLVHPATRHVVLVDARVLARNPGGELRARGSSSLERLTYSAPEQTGRINRGIDHRTDLYSLGVVLYELLLGRLPFVSSDPLELVHAHIARTPPAPVDVDPRVPGALSSIVMKLLAKEADDRYQSALGLQADLELCDREWQAHGHIEPFALGRSDASDRFLVPRRLYGREKEVAALVTAFERLCRDQRSAPSLFLVTGYSGIGKTALIKELYKPIVREHGYFVFGKFDQVVQSVPFGGLIQAVRALVQQVLTESTSRLSAWRERLSAALGVNGGVISEVIPEIELIIGPQPAPALLGSIEALNRFQLVFQNFVGALAEREHPLVLFLDDLQWADSATLGLLPALLTGQGARFLFLMGAYRDQDIDASHPLTRTLNALERSGVEVSTMALGPLSSSDLALFVRDALHCELSEAEPLARLVAEKTHGNPFFAIQFLKALEQDGYLKFDGGTGRWTYRPADVAAAPMTDNVIELMTRSLNRLTPHARRTLTLAACIGNPFDGDTLAVVSEATADTIRVHIAEAVGLGLVVPRDDLSLTAGVAASAQPATVYTFLHDRVQQAAYALIPAEERRNVHLAVGRLLLGRMRAAADESALLDVVQHLNRGRSAMATRAECLELCRLNVAAGRRVKASTAYDAALSYFETGSELLGDGDWGSEYELGFALHVELTECLTLCRQFERAERSYVNLLERAQSSLDKAKVLGLKLVAHESRSEFQSAVTVAREALSLFGVELPESPEGKQLTLERELGEIALLRGDRPIAALAELGVMAEPEIRMMMHLLTLAWSSAYISGDQPLTRVFSAMMVRLSLRYGNCEESAYGYATHAITVGPLREDYATAYELGTLALAVNTRFNDAKRRAKILQQFHAHANLWRRPLASCITYAREATQSGLENGDLTYAVYGAFTATWVALGITPDLRRFVREHSADLELFEKLKADNVADGQRVLINWARALQGDTLGPTSLTNRDLDEGVYVARYAENPFFMICHAVTKLKLCFLFGDDDGALEAARVGRGIIGHLAGTIWTVHFDFWHGLFLARLLPALDGDERMLAENELGRAARSLSVLAESCPENYEGHSLLVAAERARGRGEMGLAFDLYERAIARAERSGPVELRALAQELCGSAWLQRGLPRTGRAFLAAALDDYVVWGASAKVTELTRRYPELDSSEDAVVVPAPSNTGPEPLLESHRFDLSSAMKAARALAGEVELEKLLDALMRIALENAGAERGALLLEEDGDAFIRAAGSLEAGDVRIHAALPLDASDDVPKTIVNYVRRTSEIVVLDDARNDDRHGADPYVLKRGPRSVLCVPVVHKGRLTGVLYLENNVSTGVFTPDRASLCSMLASQAAIALENARLYSTMKQEIARRGNAEAELRTALDELESLKNRLHAENAYLQEEIRHEHNFEEMVGRSPAFLAVQRQIELVAPTDSTVLVTGETGTGKELVARAVHNLGPRQGRPLVKVNCGAISAGLVESELFGHVKGAFTGAIDRRTGRFELADGGTLFLDEVGELPLDTQVKLLRVLQEGEFEPIGSNKTIRVDVRIIAATNRDLERAVEVGRFRADLFYRLNVFRIEVPPLRARRGDLTPLVMFFLSRFAKRFGKAVDGLSRQTMELIATYDWPGNVRELSNVIERAVVLSRGPVIHLTAEELPLGRSSSLPGADGPRSEADSAGDDNRASPPQHIEPDARTLEDVERSHILRVLERTQGVIEGPRGAARILNLHPNTLRSRMKKLGVR